MAHGDEDRRSGSEEESELVPDCSLKRISSRALPDPKNKLGARYLVIGGYAIIHAGYPRFTGDLDILMDTAPENEAKIYMALRSLPATVRRTYSTPGTSPNTPLFAWRMRL